MINRLKTLILMQINNKSAKKQAKTKTSELVRWLLVALCILAITLIIYVVLIQIKKLSLLTIDKNLLLFILFITQVVSIIATTSGLLKSLYSSKDNTIIFSMPAKPGEIFVSRLLVYYLTELYHSLFFTIPFFIAFGIYLHLASWFYVLVLVMIAILPLFSVLIGTVLSLPLMYFKKLAKRFPVIKVITALAIAGLVMWLLYYITSIIPRPLKILAIYDVFINTLNSFIMSVNNYSLFYFNIIELFFGANIGINLLILFGMLAGLTLITTLITLLYFNIVSSSFEHSINTKHKSKNAVTKNTFFAFLKKELRLNFRNVEQLISHLIFLISMPFTLFLLNEIFEAITTSRLGNNIIMAVNVFVALLMLTSSNTYSASAITSEGSEFSLIKTAPSNTSRMCWAKILINFCFSLIAIVATTIMLAFITEINSTHLFVFFATLLCVNSAHILWAFQMDLLNPKLNDYAATGNLNDNKNVKNATLVGLLLSVLFAVLTLILLWNGSTINIVKLMLILIVFILAKLYLFILNLKVYFSHIQL